MRVYWVAVPKSMRARRINSLLRTLPPWLAELPLRKLLLNNCYGLEADALHSGEPASQPASERGPPAGGGQWRPAAASGALPRLPAPHRLRCAALLLRTSEPVPANEASLVSCYLSLSLLSRGGGALNGRRRHISETRITLIIDIWHPDLSDREVRFLSGLQKSKRRAEKQRSRRRSASGGASDGGNTQAAAGEGGAGHGQQAASAAGSTVAAAAPLPREGRVVDAEHAVNHDECDDFFALLRRTRGMSKDDNQWSVSQPARQLPLPVSQPPPLTGVSLPTCETVVTRGRPGVPLAAGSIPWIDLSLLPACLPSCWAWRRWVQGDTAAKQPA
jgi:hypothetical protein